MGALQIARAGEQAATGVERCLVLQLYVRSDSTLCQAAQKYAQDFSERRAGICLEVIDTLNDKDGTNRYWELVRRFRVEKPRVPLFYACDQLKVGFSDAKQSATSIEDLFAIHAYIRPTCQHCRDAMRFLTELERRWKGVRVIFHNVDSESGAIQRTKLLTQRHGITATAFPIISVCGRVISGYRTDATTGREIEELLKKSSRTVGQPATDTVYQLETERIEVLRAVIWNNAFRNQHEGIDINIDLRRTANQGETFPADSEITSSTQPPDLPPVDREDQATEEIYTAPIEAPEGIDLPWIGYVRVRDFGLPAFTLLIGLIDGFNPCAMWVLVFLLSVLVNVKDRRKIAAIAGSFVVVSGVAYFAFMAAWLNLFMLVGIARPLQIALGVLALVIGAVNVKDFFLFKKGVTLSIPEAAKPGIYTRVHRIVTTKYLFAAIGLAVVLAVLVNIVELMCTAGLPALYTQILTLQQLPAWENYAYLALYDVGYMFDDSIMVIAFVITLSHRKMRETEGRWLKLVSGIVVLALGLAMIFWPDWLQWQ
jgi:hypothetical protein